MADNDDTTKLIIYGLGIGTLLVLTYVIFKDILFFNRRQTYGFMSEYPDLNPMQYSHQSIHEQKLQLIEQKLQNLETKIDAFTTKIQVQSQSESKNVNNNNNVNKVSMKSLSGMQRMDDKLRRRLFDLH